MTKPNLSKGSLIEEAEKILENQSHFIMVYDVVESRYLSTSKRMKLFHRMKRFHETVNNKLSEHTASFSLNAIDTTEGMTILLGDSGGGAFANTSVINEILEIAEDIFKVNLRWSVGKNLEDKRIIDLIK